MWDLTCKWFPSSCQKKKRLTNPISAHNQFPIMHDNEKQVFHNKLKMFYTSS